MDKLFRFIAFLLLFAVVLGCAVSLVPDEFTQSYQRVWVRQYDYFRSLKGEKILFLGPSSLSQGLDLDYMEELTGTQCAIIGNHAGHGFPFLTNMSKVNLKAGDTVVIEYVGSLMDFCAPELMLTGVGKRYDMYRFFAKETWGKLLEAYPTYIQKNLSYWRDGGYHPDGMMSLSSYDFRGNMTFVRVGTTNPDPFTGPMIDYYRADAEFDEDFISYLNEYIKWCHERDITVLFTVQPNFDESITYTEEDADIYDNRLQAMLDAPLVSRHNDYVFTREFSYETTHLNTAGAHLRTEMLFEDIKPFLKSTENENPKSE